MLDALFPAACLGCGEPGTAFCGACHPPPRGAAWSSAGELPVAALGPYEGALRRAVLELKSGRRDVAALLAMLLAERWGACLGPQTVLVPIPTTGARRRARGFDQAALLARTLGERTGRPVAAVLRRRGHRVQQGRSREERLRSQGRFCCVRQTDLAGCTVVLVDDVVTTGATLRDAAAALRRAGVTVAAAVVVARARIGP